MIIQLERTGPAGLRHACIIISNGMTSAVLKFVRTLASAFRTYGRRGDNGCPTEKGLVCYGRRSPFLLHP
jgi:hypothetical protein